MIIREAKKSDYKDLMGLYNGFVDTDRYSKYDNDSFDKVRKSDNNFIYVAEDNGKIVGTVGIKKQKGRTARLKKMYVKKSYRGTGLSQNLYNKAQSFAKAKKYNKNVSIISAPIDTNFFRPGSRVKNSSVITIGWIGSPSTSHSLKGVEPIFTELAKRHRNFRLKMVGTPPNFFISGIKIIKKDWRLDEELPDLQSFDIGIMPLDDTPRNRNHLGYKMVQYMSVGIPVVVSNVGLKTIVKNGINGFLVNNLQDWVEKLSLLITDAELRHVLGQNGRKTAEESFSLKKLSADFINVLMNARRTSKNQ